MPAQALNPKPSWTVIDACAAPGNKTIHLVALMRNKGKVIACDADGQRMKTLRKTIEKAGAKSGSPITTLILWFESARILILLYPERFLNGKRC
jgi:16S rRNA C967 or C1407 C5-methylase (RsmB/RsmF family)